MTASPSAAMNPLTASSVYPPLVTRRYEEDVVALLAKLPPIRQNLLMSATLGTEVDVLKRLVLRRPVVLKLKESDLPGDDQLAQYVAPVCVCVCVCVCVRSCRMMNYPPPPACLNQQPKVSMVRFAHQSLRSPYCPPPLHHAPYFLVVLMCAVCQDFAMTFSLPACF